MFMYLMLLSFTVNYTFTDQGSLLRSTGVDACNSATRMDLLKTIKTEEDTIVKDELMDNFQLALRSSNVNEGSSTATNLSELVDNATPKTLSVTSTRNSTRLMGRKDVTVLSREKRKDDNSVVNKFHELKKSSGSPAQRSRCVTCFNRTILESERMPKPKTKWVTTFCADCPGKPFLCILCFSRIHCNNRIGIREVL